MEDAFAILGFGPRLVLSEDEVRTAFREAGKRLHPDAGGGEGEFSALKEAQNILASPSRRLRHWLELKGAIVETRGTIGGGLMDLFGKIGAITQRTEALIRKRDAAQSALARALLEPETQACREEVETAIADVDAVIGGECADFPAWEENPDAVPLDRVQQTVRDLTFLEKWRAGLRSGYSRLV